MLNKKGFTLIELTISISLISIVIVIASALLNYNIGNFNDTNSYFNHKMAGRHAMDIVTNEIRKHYDTSFDSGRVRLNDNNILINSVPNELNGNIRYYYDENRYGENDGYGELRGSSGNVIVKNIKQFSIEKVDENILKVTIKTGRESSKKSFELVSYVRLYNTTTPSSSEGDNDEGSSSVLAVNKPVAFDAADFQDAGDIFVSFTAVSNETNISEYRVFVVKSEQAASFDVTTASSITSSKTDTRYVVRPKSGANIYHEFYLSPMLKTADGSLIVLGQNYKVFILSVAIDGENALSEGSNDFILWDGAAA